MGRMGHPIDRPADGCVLRDFEEGDMEWMLSGLVRAASSSIHPDVRGRVDPIDLADRMGAITERLMRDQADGSAIIVAMREGERAGVIWVGHMTETFSGEESAIIWNVFVEPGHRRHGVGRALMAAAERWALTSGYRSMILNVYSGNLAAIGLYEAMGFGVDNIHMRKSIG